jgi:hypothetical protein
MNSHDWIDPKSRAGCAAAAALACAIVLGSVLSLFDNVQAPPSQVSATAPQVLVSAEGRVEGERTRVR